MDECRCVCAACRKQSFMNSKIRIHARRILHTVSASFYYDNFATAAAAASSSSFSVESETETRPLHETYSIGSCAVEQCRWIQENDSPSAQRSRRWKKKCLKLISKYIEWMTARLSMSIRLQSNTCRNWVYLQFFFSQLNTIIRALTSIGRRQREKCWTK